jgi:3-phosphoshikimate 1-carboxyvinyltransferase
MPSRALVAPPGSKSITNRALLLAGLARGTSRLTGALKSDDTRYMADALRAMGVDIEEPDATSFVVAGTGTLEPPAGPLFLGNAGTATRFLTAAVALGTGRFVVDGDEHMRKRPITPLVDALQSLGVDVSAPTGCPPVTVEGTGGFASHHVVIDAGLSSQYVSALLMAAPCSGEPFTVELAGDDIGARGYIDLTLAAMRAFGAEVEQVNAVGLARSSRPAIGPPISTSSPTPPPPPISGVLKHSPAAASTSEPPLRPSPSPTPGPSR